MAAVHTATSLVAKGKGKGATGEWRCDARARDDPRAIASDPPEVIADHGGQRKSCVAAKRVTNQVHRIHPIPDGEQCGSCEVGAVTAMPMRTCVLFSVVAADAEELSKGLTCTIMRRGSHPNIDGNDGPRGVTTTKGTEWIVGRSHTPQWARLSPSEEAMDEHKSWSTLTKRLEAVICVKLSMLCL